MNCDYTSCANCANNRQGRDCPHSAQASRDALSLFANPWFWIGGAISVWAWHGIFTLVT
jgi:hypothetical protein